jgi:ABC-type siderophore export system fused ATPase/permease subunit
VVQNRTVFDLRRDVEDKLNRLPLPYFDQQPRGELLSRVTNDIDNISQTPAADPEPAAHLAADGHRACRDDALDLVDCWR